MLKTNDNILLLWMPSAEILYLLLNLFVNATVHNDHNNLYNFLQAMFKSNRGTVSGYFLAGRFMTWLPVCNVILFHCKEGFY